MAGVSPHRSGSAVARRRQQEARRRLYVRRRITVLVLLLAAIVGAYFGIDWAISRWLSGAGGTETKPNATAAELAFTPEVLIPAGDLDQDGKPEQVAVGPTKNTQRQIALVTGTKAPFKQIGAAWDVPAFRLEIRDLPGAKGILVMQGTFPTTGESSSVEVPGGGKAKVAAGGEPLYQAWRLDKAKGLVPEDFYALAAPDKPTTDIVVNKWLNVLWFYKDGKLAGTYRVSTGRHLDGPPPSDANQSKNYLTPVGKYTITNLQENPVYNKGGIKGGDTKNPLGTRWMGFSVFTGDGAGYWGIHGTNEPEHIGKWVSDGCIRMKNTEIELLYPQIKKGMTLEITDKKL